MAAAVVVAVGLVSLLNVGKGNVASAAERLKEAVERTASYRGWVRYEHGTLGKDGRRVPTWAMRLNTEDGTCGSEELGPERSRGYVQLPGRGVAIDYLRATNTAHVHELNPFDGDQAWMSRLYTLEGVLQEMQERTGGQLGVSVGRDGDADKYTVDVPAGPDTPAFRCEVWVDPRTKLVQRIHRNGPHPEASLVVAVTLAYGVPPVRDIRDVGAPADAKVIDERPAGEAKELLDRLDRRVIEGFGDHTAVLTSERQGQGEKWSSLRLFGRSGSRHVQYDYGVSDRPSDAPAPDGWPTPTVAAALRAVGNVRPGSFHVFDDSQPGRPRAWVGNYDSKGAYYRGLGTPVRDRVEMPAEYLLDRWRMQLRESAAYRVWPGRAEMRLFFFPSGGLRGARYEVRRDERRPGLRGLVISFPPDKDGVDRRRGFELWVDPGRDDVPVEFVERSAESSDPGVSEYRTRYAGHAQTANGRWYPTQWVTTATDFDAGGNVVGGVRTDRFFLRVETDAPLPEYWYENPLRRLMALPAERGAAGQAALDAGGPPVVAGETAVISAPLLTGARPTSGPASPRLV